VTQATQQNRPVAVWSKEAGGAVELSPWAEERKTGRESKREREREKESVSVTRTGSQGRASPSWVAI
jgi:hypothetical protein